MVIEKKGGNHKQTFSKEIALKWQVSQRLRRLSRTPYSSSRSITEERCKDTISKMFNETLQTRKKFNKDKNWELARRKLQKDPQTQRNTYYLSLRRGSTSPV